MRIAVDAREWVAGRRTGIGRYLETIIGRAVDTRPHLEWRLFLHPGDERRVRADPVEYVEIPRRPAPFVDQVTLPRRLRQDPPSLFFSPYPKSPWLAPCPVVVVVHDLLQLVLPTEWGGLSGWRRLWFRWYVGNSTRRAAHVVTDSLASARDIDELLGVPLGRVTVVHAGIDPSLMSDAEARRPVQLGGGERTFFLAVGTLKPHKNHARLLRAWSRACDASRDALLLIAGDGPEAPSLRALAAELELGDRVAFLGGVDDAVLAYLYRNALALLQPSLIEGFGLPVLEAMALGTPVVVSDGGSLPEVVDDAAPIVAADDVDGWAAEMRRLLSVESYRRECVEAVSRRARDFAPEQTSDRLLDLLEATAQAAS